MELKKGGDYAHYCEALGIEAHPGLYLKETEAAVRNYVLDEGTARALSLLTLTHVTFHNARLSETALDLLLPLTLKSLKVDYNGGSVERLLTVNATVLSLRGNNVDAELVAQSLPTAPCEALNLFDNKITDQGATLILEALRSSSLKHLSLANNLLGTSSALVALHTVIGYEVTKSKIDIGGRKFAKPKQDLKTLDLSSNKIDDLAPLVRELDERATNDQFAAALGPPAVERFSLARNPCYSAGDDVARLKAHLGDILL